jgi:hypothetical protein
MINKKPSKLTTLAEQKKTFGHKTMSKDAIAWMYEKIDEIRRPATIATAISRENDRKTNQFRVGMMYCFFYDPKTKGDLPYWDKFPLVLILEKHNDGFLGLNLHYLPLKFRIAFLSKLMRFALLDAKDDINRMRISYEILQASKRYAEFRPCIKRYLLTNVRSRILRIKPNEWDIATMLPLQQFKKANAQTVWKDSVQEYREHMAHFNKIEE